MDTLKEDDLDNEIRIISNGSHFSGDPLSSIDELINVLREHDLDIKRFAVYGFCTWHKEKNNIKLWGNFLKISHVFEIEGPELSPTMNKLYRAIEENIERIELVEK